MRRRTTWTLLGATLLLWLAAAGTALSAAGDLDGTFGAGGRATIDLGGDEDVAALVLQADGRIIVGGDRLTAGPDGRDGVVVLLTPQGALDTTYGGGGGFSRLNFGPQDHVTGVAQQSNGRIIAVGFTNAGANGFAVGLLNPAGTLDPAFGGGNGVYSPAFANASFSAVTVAPDDRVVIAGTIPGAAVFETDMTVVRLAPGGAIDPAYAGGFGWSRVGFPGQAGLEFGTGIGLQADGRIIVAGLTPGPGVLSLGIARLLNPQGTFDSTFGPANNGTATVRVGPIGFNGPALAMAPDGGIVLASLNDASNAIVARLRGTGVPDTGFSDDGVAIGAPGAFGGVAVQRDGKIVAVGGTPGAGGTNDVLVMRFQPNGQPDSTFSGDGKVTIDLGGADGARAVAIQPDGRIVVGASTDSNTDVVVLRLEGDATTGAGPGGGPGGGGAAAAPTCGGRAATIIGSAGRDRLTGTAKPDVIAGLAGNDTIDGLGGNDLVCGGPGVDSLRGSAGADRLLGEAGADILTGGAGADVLTGGAGADRLLGGSGRDRLLGGAGADRLVGGGGIDVLTGGAGRNVRIQ